MNDPREELLRHRVLEYQALDDDWNELATLARSDSRVWERLAEGLRDEGALKRRLEGVFSRADRVEVPAFVPPRRSPVLLISGWAAALLLGALWLFSQWSPPETTPLAEPLAAGSLSQTVEELPAMMIETVPAEDGNGYDVLYLRQTLERVRVNGVYQLARDEHGQPAPTLTRWSLESSTERM